MTNKLNFEITKEAGPITATRSKTAPEVLTDLGTAIDKLEDEVKDGSTSGNEITSVKKQKELEERLIQANVTEQTNIESAIAAIDANADGTADDPNNQSLLEANKQTLDQIKKDIAGRSALEAELKQEKQKTQQYITATINDLFKNKFVIAETDVDALKKTGRKKLPVYFRLDGVGGAKSYFQISSDLTLDANGVVTTQELQKFFTSLFSELTNKFSDYSLEKEELTVSIKNELAALQNSLDVPGALNVDAELSKVESKIAILGAAPDELEVQKKILIGLNQSLDTEIGKITTLATDKTTAVNPAEQNRLEALRQQKDRVEEIQNKLFSTYVASVRTKTESFLIDAQRFQFDPSDVTKVGASNDINDLDELQIKMNELDANIKKAKGLIPSSNDNYQVLERQEKMMTTLKKVVATKIAIVENLNRLNTLRYSEGDFNTRKTSDPVLAAYATYDALKQDRIRIEGELRQLYEKLGNQQGVLVTELPNTSVRADQKTLIEHQNKRLLLQQVDEEQYNSNKNYREQTNKLLGVTSTGRKDGRKEIQDKIGSETNAIKGTELQMANKLGLVIESNDPLVTKTGKFAKVPETTPPAPVDRSGNVDAGGTTLTPDGKKKLEELMTKHYDSEEALNADFAQFLTPSQIADLQKRRLTLPASELRQLSPHYKGYLTKYQDIMNDRGKSAAVKAKETALAENGFLKSEVGTIREWRKAGKKFKKLRNYEAKKMVQIEKAVTLLLEKERLEAVNERGAQYALYLRSYDTPGATLTNPPAYPKIEDVTEKIIAAGGPMADAMALVMMNNGREDLANLMGAGATKNDRIMGDFYKGFAEGHTIMRKNNITSLGGMYGSYADVMYGYPINQPSQTAERITTSVTTAEYNDHNQANIDVTKTDARLVTVKMWRLVRSKDANAQKEFPRSYGKWFAEVGRRHLGNIDGYNFKDATQKMKDDLHARLSGTAKAADGTVLPPLSPDERDLMVYLDGLSEAAINNQLENCFYAMIDDRVVADIQEQYVQYRDRDHQSQDQLISLFAVNAIVHSHNIPLSQAEHIKRKLTELRGGSYHSSANTTEGNEEVGKRIRNYIENGDPLKAPLSGLGKGKNWMNESLGRKDYFVRSDGTFRGVPGTINLMVGNFAKVLGIPEKHISTISAFATAGVAVAGISYAWQFVAGYMLKGSFGEKIRKTGVTALLLGAGLPALTGSDLGERYDRTVNGAKDKKGILKIDESKIGKMLGVKEDPDFKDPAYEETKDSVTDIFGEVKIGDLAKYMTYRSGPVIGGETRFEMSDAQARLFLADPNISDDAKQFLQILIKSKGNAMGEVSKFLNLGLEDLGLTHDRYPTLLADPKYADMKIATFALKRGEFEKFSGGAIGSLIGDKARLEELFKLRGNRTPAERESFDKRVEEMQAFEKKRKELMPYLKNFVDYRDDMHASVGLATTDQSILSTGLQDKDKYYTYVMYEYLNASLTSVPDMTKFEAQFGKMMCQDDAECKTFLKTYLFDNDAITKLKDLGSGAIGIDKMRANCDTDMRLVGNDGTGVERKEVLMHDIPGCEKRPDEEAFFEVNATNELCIWTKDPASQQRKEYKLQRIGGKVASNDPAKTDGFKMNYVYKDGSIATNTSFKMNVTNDGATGDIEFSEEILGNMVDQLKTGNTKFKVMKEHMKTKFPTPPDSSRWDPIVTAGAGVAGTVGTVVDLIPFVGKKITGTVRDISRAVVEDAQDVATAASKIFPYTTIKFEPTGNIRPER